MITFSGLLKSLIRILKIEKKKLGESSGHKHKHKKSKKDKSKEAKSDPKVEDELNHAGAWLVENLNQITGTIVIELKEYSYMHGLDNGLFVMGAPHEVSLHFDYLQRDRFY